MRAVGYASTDEAIVGFRSWRVMPFRRLDGSASYRLCAMGSNGVPKVWEPRRANTAVCSAYESHHEAPWPDHECGLWALKDLDVARKRMMEWISKWYCGDPVGVAIGQVSLWGRVIEHEHGYRSQYAYPYALTLETPDEEAVRVIRREYAVDVEWAGGDLFNRAVEKRRRRLERERAAEEKHQRELDENRERLREISAGFRRTHESTKVSGETTSERLAAEARALPPVSDLADMTVDETAIMVLAAIASWNAKYPDRKKQQTGHTYEILNAALGARGESPPLSDHREGVRAARRNLGRKLRAARDAGLLDHGVPYLDRHYKAHGSWFLTAEALRRVIGTRGPVVVSSYESDWVGRDQCWNHKLVELDLKAAARVLLKLDRPLFVGEVEEKLSGWRDERRAAQRQGKRRYAEWLATTRDTGHPMQLSFDDDEVIAAIDDLCRRRRVPAVATVTVISHLAPGKRSNHETPRFSQQLVRLARTGHLSRLEVDGKPAWQVAVVSKRKQGMTS